MSSACWTCRLRRKKCDRVRPVCASCARLHIGCDYSHVKPEWMDGSEKQAEMTKTIQAQIRQGAAAVDDTAFAVQVFPLRGTPSSQNRMSESKTGTSLGGSTRNLNPSRSNETDDFLTSLYLETVFPSLFPWYQPQTLEGGRSWLLTMLKTNQAAFHAAISLSAYYFTRLLARDANNTLRTPCEQHVWDIWAGHMDLSMQLIRQNLSDASAGREQTDIFHQSRVLDSIVHLLIFEASLANSGDWNLHLTAALSQLQGIFQRHGLKDGKYHLHSVLLNMQRPSVFDVKYLGYHVWSADQTSFQFSTAVLLYADIVASVCLGRTPQLRPYYDALIAKSNTAATQGDQLVHMEHYFGCYGWAFILIGEIAALDAWKLAAKSDDGANIEELLVLGKDLEMRLYHGLESMTPNLALCELPGKANQSEPHVLVTKLWLHAGLIYLSTILHGWQATDPAIRTNIHTALNLVKIIALNLKIRCPMWPLCVASCMVKDDEKLDLRRIMSALPPIQTFGANKEVVNIIEAAWHHRDRLEETMWSLADFFRCQVPSVLLL